MSPLATTTTFDVLVSGNQHGAIHIHIRSLPDTSPRPQDTYLYEITTNHPDRLIRGTLHWQGTDQLDLIRAVLDDYTATTTKRGVI